MGRFANDDSHSPVLNVVNWFLLVVVILSVLTRLGIELWRFRRFTSDDYLIFLSMIFCVGESIAISVAVSHGYGSHSATIDELRLGAILKAQYAAFLLFILSLYFSKLSLSIFIRNLSPVQKDHRHAAALQVILTVWAVVAIFGSAFQCHTPRTWDHRGECFDIEAWHTYFCISNIVTDALIVLQALLLISRIQASWKKKVIFAVIFLSRILVILASVAQLTLTHHLADSDDRTYEDYSLTIAIQAVQCTSIVQACWGQIKPFLNWLKSSGLQIPDTEYLSTTSGKSKSSYRRWPGRENPHPRSPDTNNEYQPQQHHELVPIRPGQGNMTMVSASGAGDTDSQSSQVKMIRETRTWRVSEAQRSERSDSI